MKNCHDGFISTLVPSSIVLMHHRPVLSESKKAIHITYYLRLGGFPAKITFHLPYTILDVQRCRRGTFGL